jgi:mannose/fructose-specific phosphotransferase system component IIA
MADGAQTGVLLVAHGDYGARMVEAAEAIVGPLEIRVVTVRPEAEPHEVGSSVEAGIAEQDSGGGVLVLTDLCGSTPANVCQAVVGERADCEVLSGLNLPMLIKLSTCDRSIGAHQLAQELMATSRRSIVVGRAVPSKRRDQW